MQIKMGGFSFFIFVWESMFLELLLGKICMFYKYQATRSGTCGHQAITVSEWKWREIITNAQQIFVKQSYVDTFQMNCQGYGVAGIQPKSFAFAQCYKNIL